MFSFICPLFLILGVSLLNSIIFKEKFERVLVIGILEMVMITYLFGFLDMRIGLGVSIILAFLSIPFYLYSNKKQEYSLKELFFTDLFFSFLFLFAIIFMWNIGKKFCRWDEFSHWGMMAKEMFRLDKYYYLDESVLEYHKEYPPFTTILQYIWCKLCGEYKERHLYSAKIIFSLSTFFPVYSWMLNNKKKIENRLTRLLNIIFVPLLFIVISNLMSMGEASYYRTIYTEGVLCSLVFYAFFSLLEPFKSSCLNIFNLALTLVALVLTKQMGIYFCALVICGYILLKMVNGKFKKTILDIIIIAGIPLSCWSLWNTVTSKYVARGQFDSSRFSVDEIIALIQGNGQEYQYITIDNLFDAILKRPLLLKPIHLSYIAIVLIFVIIMFLYYRCNKESVSFKKYWVLNIGFVVAAIGYIFVMLILYFFGFSKVESMGLVCYERYMSAMLFPMVMISCIYLISIILQKSRCNSSVILAICTVGMLIGGVPRETFEENIVPGILCDNISDVFIGDATIINENTAEDDKVYVICQGDIGGNRNIIAYLSVPRRMNMYYFNVTEADKELVFDMVKDYDYLFLSNVDDIFVGSYGEWFEDENLKGQQLYKIHSELGICTFERIY